MFKTTLFKAHAASHCTHNGSALRSPSTVTGASPDSEKVLWHKGYLDAENPLRSPGYIAYSDQEITIDDGKAIVKGRNTHSGKEVESVLEFRILSSRSLEESDLENS